MNKIDNFSDFELGLYIVVTLNDSSKVEGHFTGFGYTNNMYTEGEVSSSIIVKEGPEGIFVDDKPILFSVVKEIEGDL